jgi:hypothetical protein
MVYLFLKQENPWVGEMRIPALKSFLKYGCTRLSKFRYRQIAKLLKEDQQRALPRCWFPLYVSHYFGGTCYTP